VAPVVRLPLLGNLGYRDSFEPNSGATRAAFAWIVPRDTIPTIVAYSKKLAVDLIVVGHYPTAEGRRWWAGPERASLAELVDCCLFIAVGEGA